MTTKDTRKNRVCLQQKENFNTLIQAVKEDNVCLMDCILKSTGEHVAVLCAVQPAANKEIETVPFAMFFNGNPYEMLTSPLEYESLKETRD